MLIAKPLSHLRILDHGFHDIKPHPDFPNVHQRLLEPGPEPALPHGRPRATQETQEAVAAVWILADRSHIQGLLSSGIKPHVSSRVVQGQVKLGVVGWVSEELWISQSCGEGGASCRSLQDIGVALCASAFEKLGKVCFQVFMCEHCLWTNSGHHTA